MLRSKNRQHCSSLLRWEKHFCDHKEASESLAVGDYFKNLKDADLARAARYFAGHQFALTDARTTNVGGSIISQALSQATGFAIEDLLPRYVRLGDAGEVAYEVVTEAKQNNHRP